MKDVIRITLKVFSISLIVIMGLFVLNNALFTHTHVLPDGTIVTHAHPVKTCKKNPSKSHTHVRIEIIQMDKFALLFFIASAGLILAPKFEGRRIPLYNSSSSCEIAIQHLAVRGPPLR